MSSAPLLERHPARRQIVLALVVLGSGLALGIATQILQGVLPGGWNVLANSGVIWALAAFGLGMVMPSVRHATSGGASQLVIASVSYYAAVDLFEGTGSDLRSTMVWSVAGIVVGAAFAAAGHFYATRADRRDRALALVAGVLTGEGIRLTWFVGNAALRTAGIVELALGVLCATACVVRATKTGCRSTAPEVVAVLVAASTATILGSSMINAVFAAR